MISRPNVEEGVTPPRSRFHRLSVFVIMLKAMIVVELLLVDLIRSKRVFVARTIIVDDVALAWVLQNWMIPS